MSAALVAACTSKTARPRATPTAAPSSAPRVVIDDLNRRVELKGTPQRIVALSPSTVEILFAIGVTPVGRPSSAHYPAEAKQVVDIGQARNPNPERIADVKPDLIIADIAARDPQVPQLESLGVPVIIHNINGYNDVLRCMRLAGDIAGKQAQAQTATKKIEDKVAGIKAKVPAKQPTVFILVGSGKAIYGALPNSYVGSLVKELGATNVVSGAEDAKYRGVTASSMEKLVASDPDVIVAIRPMVAASRAPSALPTLRIDPRWQGLKAVQNSRVHEVSPLLFIQNPGPRAGDAIAELATLLYPESFGK